MDSFISTLQAKDVLTLSISTMAITVSILSTYLNSRQKKFETERTLRSQLTDVFGKLTALNLELAKIPEQGASPSGVTRAMTGHIRDQQRFLVRQATYLSDQVPELTTPFEYLLIAGGFAEIGDITTAETFFQKARESV